MVSSIWNWAGARWWKFDFHAHTAKSDCYGQGQDQAILKNRTAQEWLLDYMRAGIDCVAVTDHNSGEWIDALQEANNQLKVQQHKDYRQLYIFPGVELTVQGNVHILGIFPRETTGSAINSVVDRCRYRGTKGKSDDCTEEAPAKVIEEIVNSDGIAIPAHVDKERGLFHELTGNTLNQVLDSPYLFAAELLDAGYQFPAVFREKKLKWTTIIGSDQHHPSGSAGLKYPGSHFTWIKMAEPSLEGLRLALLDGELSVKRSDCYTGEPNEHGQLVVESVKVENAKYMGQGEPLQCTMNPWLNTIIGGRGTGKSTIVEFCRQIFRREKELPESLKKEYEKYCQLSNGRRDEGLLRDNSVLSAIYRKDGARFKVQWSSDGTAASILEEASPDNWQVAYGEITQRFPIRIYSQKQIFELAKQPQALLKIIDDAPEVHNRQWRERWDQLENKYLSLCAQTREIESGLKEIPRIQGELDDVTRKLDVFEKAGHAEILKAYQLRQRQLRALDAWEQSWQEAEHVIINVSEEILPSDFEASLFSIDQSDEGEVLAAISDKTAKIGSIRQELVRLAESVSKERLAWLSSRQSLKINAAFTDTNKKYEYLKEQLSVVGASNPNEYGRLVQHRQGLEEQLKTLVSRKQQLVDLGKQVEEILEQLNAHRTSLTKLRSDFLATVLHNNPHVSISVLPYRHKVTIEDEIRKLINRAQGGFDKDIGIIDGDTGLLQELYSGELTVEKLEVNIASFKKKIKEIHSGNQDHVKDKRFSEYMTSLPPETMDRLMCWFPEDSLHVEYRPRPDMDLRPLHEGSPGQKTAALLAFLLSYGNEPLMLDQPEDDLDNHLIYDLIVSQLKEKKQRRQIIIVTHNANIVVNGDSENVIAMDVRSGQSRILSQGSLQSNQVREEICRVMEGGKEAFDMRYKRIKAGGS